MVPPDRVILLDDLGVNIRHKEDGGEDSETCTGSHDHRSDVPPGFLVQAQLGRSLVDDRKSADGPCDEEKEGRGPNSPFDWIPTNMNRVLDEQENGGSETCRNRWSHGKTGENRSKAFPSIPTPLNLARANGSNTDTRYS